MSDMPEVIIRKCDGHPLGVAPLGPSWAVDIPGQPRFYSDGWHFATREDAEEYVARYRELYAEEWLNTLCCGAGEPPPDAKTVAEWDAPPPEPVRARVIHRIEDALICPACIRLRFSPIHLCLRMVGICDGKGAVG